jgi:hypothetical protein
MPKPPAGVHDDDAELTREERLRRVVLVCTIFMRNLAYYRGAQEFRVGWAESPLVSEASFWRTVANNALDISVLEFCKLFGERRGNHFWGQTVSDSGRFQAELLRHLKMSSQQLDGYVEQMRHYRDKFVAHLDDDRTMRPPDLSLAKSATEFYHSYILDNEAPPGCLSGLVDSAAKLTSGFDAEIKLASSIFRKISADAGHSSE